MNKPRLIDANEILKHLAACKSFPAISYFLKDFQDLILAQPTAYDTDKVVEQLEALPNINQNYHSSTEMIDREDAIEIVRKAVRNDRNNRNFYRWMAGRISHSNDSEHDRVR